MEITLSHTEAEQFAYDRLSRDLANDNIKVHIAIPKSTPAPAQEPPFREIGPFKPAELNQIWRSAIRPVNNVNELRPAKIDLIKLYRALHLELCEKSVDLTTAKIFVETHL